MLPLLRIIRWSKSLCSTSRWQVTRAVISCSRLVAVAPNSELAEFTALAERDTYRENGFHSLYPSVTEIEGAKSQEEAKRWFLQSV